MNCATHSDTAAVAFCRTCGKPLCQTCTRDVRGVIYCEECLAARLDGTAPAFAPPAGTVPPEYVPPAPGFVPPASGLAPPQTPPQTGYQQFMDQGLGLKVRPGPTSGPNPALAGILAGFFPFGVGAVYNGQYAKGLAHLVIFTLLVWGESVVNNDGLNTILGLGIAFFY